MYKWLIYIGFLFLCPILFMGLIVFCDWMKQKIFYLYKEIISFKHMEKSEQIATIFVWLSITGILLIMIGIRL